MPNLKPNNNVYSDEFRLLWINRILEERRSRNPTSQKQKSGPTEWERLARPNQLPPAGDWRYWLICAGRGFGKTRAGSEWIIHRARSGNYKRIGLIGETAADVRDVMVQGPSGVLTKSPDDFRPRYYPSRRMLLWPNGAEAHTYSGDDPEQLRGPEHDTVWADEPAKWRNLKAAWENMDFGLRQGPNPQCCATTTPKPIPWIKELLTEAKTENADVVVTSGSTYENEKNLAPSFLKRLKKRYEGTRIGLQELHAQVLEDREGALWRREAMIEAYRRAECPGGLRIVVGVDPSASDGEEAAECGIVVGGKMYGEEGHGFVLADYSKRGSPLDWAREVVAAFTTLKADRIVAEANQGGKMVEATLRSVKPNLPITLVHASKGKEARAEPVSALYEQGRIHHVGTFAVLEDQLCEWAPGEPSPDRLDALVWCMTELFDLGQEPENPLRGAFLTGSAKGWSPR